MMLKFMINHKARETFYYGDFMYNKVLKLLFGFIFQATYNPSANGKVSATGGVMSGDLFYEGCLQFVVTIWV